MARQACDAFASGDIQTFLALHDDNVVFHVPGRSRFAGEHRGKQAFADVLQQQVGTLDAAPQVEIHDVLASDDHAVALLTIRGTRRGRPVELRQAAVVHIRDGRITESWALPEDQYAADELAAE